MSYPEHVEFYRHVADVYPEQIHYNEPAVRRFLDDSSGPVLELGGWKGELAKAVLPDYPDIPEWLNVEIAPQAVSENVCIEPRYSVIVPHAFLWDTDLDLTRFRTFIASHSIEHIKKAHLLRLMDRLRTVERMYVDAPLPDKPSGWNGEHSHIIEVGWDGLRDIFASYGFRHIGTGENGRWGPAYWFSR